MPCVGVIPLKKEERKPSFFPRANASAMQHQTQTHTVHRIELYKVTKQFHEFPLHYCFSVAECEREPKFYISIRHRQEQGEVAAGSDLLRALDFFRRIVRGGVLPLTLPELSQDFAYCEKF